MNLKKIIYPSRLMRVKPKTRFEYFRKICRGELVYRPALRADERRLNYEHYKERNSSEV